MLGRMATIGTLNVSVSAKLGKFEKGMKKAAGTVGGFAKKIASLAGPVGKVTSVLGILSGAGLGVMMQKTAQSIDKMAKLSDEIGFSTEALTGLQHAADITGTNFEVLSKGLRKMLRNIGDATTGIAMESKAFEALGLEAEKLASMKPEDAFLEIAGAINEQTTASERAATATNLFGRAGTELLNLFAEGKGGIAALTKEAEELGLTFSRVDAAEVEAANDALTRVKAVIAGALRAAVIKLAPFVEAIAKSFTDWAKSGGGAGKKVVAVLEWVVGAVAEVVRVVKILGGVWKIQMGVLIGGAGALLKILAEVIDALTDAVEWLPGVEFDFDDDFVEFADGALENSSKMIDAGVEWIKTSGDAAEAAKTFFASIEEGSRKAAEATVDAKKRLDVFDPEKSDRARKAREDAARAEKQAADEIKRYNENLTASIEKRERIAGMSEEERRYSSEILEIEEARARNLGDLAGRLEVLLAKKRQEAAAEAAKTREKEKQLELDRERDRMDAERERIQSLKEALELEIARAQAADEFARRQIDIQTELADRLEQAGRDQETRQLAIQAAAEKLLDLEKDRAEEAKKTADELERQAEAAEKKKKSAEQEVATTREAGGGGGGRRGGGGGSSIGTSRRGRQRRGEEDPVRRRMMNPFAPARVKEARLFGSGGPTVSEYRAKQKAAAAKKAADAASAEEVAAGGQAAKDGALKTAEAMAKATTAVAELGEPMTAMSVAAELLADDGANLSKETATTLAKTVLVLETQAKATKNNAEEMKRLQSALEAIRQMLSGSP